MKTNKKALRSFAVILCAVVFFFSAISAAIAASTSDAKEPIDTSKKGSLSLTYSADKKKLEGMEIALYRIASVTADFQYSMTGAFSDYPIWINGIKSQSEWDEVKETVGAYITADGIAPEEMKKTGPDGTVRFDDLSLGIYYFCWTGNDTPDHPSGFAPSLIAVPNLGEDGKWIYDVDALPKPGKLPDPEEGKYKIVKLWRDEADNAKRPDKIPVDIYRDGKLYESIELHAENNWTYSWQSDGKYKWTAVEREVPEGYTVSVKKSGSTIQITNTAEGEPVTPPQTGDNSVIYIFASLAALSGIALILLGRRKEHEE